MAALKAQFTGATHWDKEVKVHDTVLRDCIFNGRSGNILQNFVATHCAAFHRLQICATIVTCIVPDGRERVTFLTDGMAKCNDANVKATLVKNCLDDPPTGMRNKFEKAVAYLIPTDPIKGKKKRDNADVSADGATVVGSTAGRGGERRRGGGQGGGGGCDRGRGRTQFKPTKGKTGVEILYYVKT